MRAALVEQNPDLVLADPEWVVRIVGVENEKERLLQAFTDAESDSPVVATTSRLLSTGVDVQDLKFVVLFRPVGSTVEFKQIIGRGTRLYPDKAKTSFEIIDRYAAHGVGEVTAPEALRVVPLSGMGTPVEIAGFFGGAGGFHASVDDLQRWLCSA